MLRRLIIVGVGLVVAIAAAQAADSRVRIHGSNTVGERLMPELLEAWLRSKGQDEVIRQQLAFEELLLVSSGGLGKVKIELHAHGSTTAFQDLSAGTADIGMASRRVTQAEIDRAAHLGALDAADQETVLALDGLAIIVRRRLATLDGQITGVFAGVPIGWWSNGQFHGSTLSDIQIMCGKSNRTQIIILFQHVIILENKRQVMIV